MKQKSLPLFKDQKHRRSIDITTCRLDEKSIQLRGELTDERQLSNEEPDKTYMIHHIVVRLTVSYDVSRHDLIITEADFSTLKGTFKSCEEYPVSAKELLGVSAGKGFTKKIYDLYGGTRGCSHIYTILSNMTSAIRQGAVFTIRFPDEEKQLTEDNLGSNINRMARDLEDSCFIWEKNGPGQKKAAAGDFEEIVERIYPNYKKR